MSVEHIVDGIMRAIKKNLVARIPITSDVSIGTGVIEVSNNFYFESGNEVTLVDSNGTQEHHVLVRPLGTKQLQLLHPVEHDFLVTNNTIVQKTIGHVPLFENDVLYGDRAVIPTEQVSVVVEPVSLDNEWMYLQGGLSENYNIAIMIYLREDKHESALRIVSKYADRIYSVLMSKLHTDIVNQVVPVTANVTAGDTEIEVASTDGFLQRDIAEYEIQDNNNVEIDFKLTGTLTSPTRVVFNRGVLRDYDITENAVVIWRSRYIYDSRPTNIEYGTVSKESGLYKAAKITWFGKETEDYRFPQHSNTVEP